MGKQDATNALSPIRREHGISSETVGSSPRVEAIPTRRSLVAESGKVTESGSKHCKDDCFQLNASLAPRYLQAWLAGPVVAIWKI